MRRYRHLGLQKRIMLYVAVGLTVMFGVVAVLGLDAIDEATRLVYREPHRDLTRWNLGCPSPEPGGGHRLLGLARRGLGFWLDPGSPPESQQMTFGTVGPRAVRRSLDE